MTWSFLFARLSGRACIRPLVQSLALEEKKRKVQEKNVSGVSYLELT